MTLNTTSLNKLSQTLTGLLSSKPLLIVPIGIPGCGKTTFGNSLGDHVVICSSDKYIEAEATQQRKTYNEVFKKVVKQADMCFKLDVADSVSARKHVYIDRTNLSRKALDYTTLFKDYLKIGVIFPQHTWERMNEVNSKRFGKEISFELFSRFYDAYSYHIDFDRRKTESYFDLILEVD